jgi:hypothetical protein
LFVIPLHLPKDDKVDIRYRVLREFLKNVLYAIEKWQNELLPDRARAGSDCDKFTLFLLNLK